MKKILLTLALTSLSVTAALAEPTLSGRIFMIGNYVNGEFKDNNANSNANDNNGIRRNGDFDGDTFEIESHKSSIGIEGSYYCNLSSVVFSIIFRCNGLRVEGEGRSALL